jgi:hypothetical protein
MQEVGNPLTCRLTLASLPAAQFKPPIAALQQVRSTKTHDHFAVPASHTIKECFQFHTPADWQPG